MLTRWLILCVFVIFIYMTLSFVLYLLIKDFAILGIWFGGGGPWVTTIDFHPNGRLLAAGYSHGFISIWDLATTSQILRIKEDGWVEDIDFSPDGRLLASCTGKDMIHIWDISSNCLIRKLYYFNCVFNKVAFNPNGKLLASGGSYYEDDHKVAIVILWKISEGTPAFILKPHSIEEVTALSFSPNGCLLAIGGDTSLRKHPTNILVWDVETGKLIKTYQCIYKGTDHWECFTKDLTFHPDGEKIAIGVSSEHVYIWNIQTDKIQILRGHKSWVESVTFSPNRNFLATTAEDNTVRLWDINTGKCINIFKADNLLFANIVAFSPKGDLLAFGGVDGQIRLLRLSRFLWRKWKLWKILKFKFKTEKSL